MSGTTNSANGGAPPSTSHSSITYDDTVGLFAVTFTIKRMINGGCLQDIDRVFGLHVWNFMEAGMIGVAPGPITAFSDRIYIDIVGAGGHGSMPQGT